jgi:hypothetical protein
VNDNLPSLRDQARAAITTLIVTTCRQVPARVEAGATLLLVDVWTAGLVHGVQPEDWRADSGRVRSAGGSSWRQVRAPNGRWSPEPRPNCPYAVTIAAAIDD